MSQPWTIAGQGVPLNGTHDEIVVAGRSYIRSDHYRELQAEIADLKKRLEGMRQARDLHGANSAYFMRLLHYPVVLSPSD